MPPGKPASSWVNCKGVEGKSGRHILRKAEHKVFWAFTSGFRDFTQLLADY